jgi:hypothetical protein
MEKRVEILAADALADLRNNGAAAWQIKALGMHLKDEEDRIIDIILTSKLLSLYRESKRVCKIQTPIIRMIHSHPFILSAPIV